MKSLRARLLAGTTIGTIAVLLGAGAVLYALMSGTLRAEFDESLAAKARSLAALAEQDKDGLEFELAEISLPEFEPSEHAEYYQVWLPDGTVFARSPSLCGGDLNRVSDTSDPQAFQTVTLPDGRPGRIVGLTFVPRQEDRNGRTSTPRNVTLVLARDVVGLQAMLSRVRGILIGVCIAAAALSAAVLSRVVRRGVEPIDDLSTRIAGVGEHDLSARLDLAGLPTEIAPVAVCLNDLLARLEAAFQRERRFTGDVAHELRTPLAGLRSTLELALSRDRTPAAYRKAMDDCLQINLQMQRMAENLLHLARADAGQLDLRREAVDVSEIVRDCWKPLEEQASARKLRVEAHLDAIEPIETDPDKLRLVLQNILDNAVTHANREGAIRLAGHLENAGVVLTVSNTGCSLPPRDAHRVFDRFWRGDASCREAGQAHCGLGLPLCRTMIERLNGSIEANITADGVFMITIRLPHCDPGENREHA